ncbi:MULTISPECIES: segregation and condensation protein A [unclassified Acinetobacter]|uniref:segregation and condensation protein A n=1 Tax=unclassified Acinetobacter TaxID=196816 RepID=UPI002934182F|nr:MULTISPECIES: segregation/condensation protein A [unclassified Acinetobacter]WOE31366.1 segregation/condensation protein A [Acinetobacter sp. SAAs470]WOE39562.1 segregation/condensation protein A [Acinetobacter sp. SAAs474]
MTQIVQNAMENLQSIRVMDEWQDELPEDLYIPPAAFEILLEHFEGPLDFLIYLIQKNGFDLINLDIAPIASQYLAYMDSMKSLNIELTADYMVMAALLADLKSRLLLPKPASINIIEKDPKQNLIDRLETYLNIKHAAERLNQMSILERDTFQPFVNLEQIPQHQTYAASQLHDALQCLFNRPEPIQHQILQEPVLLEERIASIQQQLQQGQVLEFKRLLKPSQGRLGMVVTFMAVLELSRQQKICIITTGIDAPLTIQRSPL